MPGVINHLGAITTTSRGDKGGRINDGIGVVVVVVVVVVVEANKEREEDLMMEL